MSPYIKYKIYSIIENFFVITSNAYNRLNTVILFYIKILDFIYLILIRTSASELHNILYNI